MHYRQATILTCFILVSLCCAASRADEASANPLTRSSVGIEDDEYLLQRLMACTRLLGNATDSSRQHIGSPEMTDVSLEKCQRAIYTVIQILFSEHEAHQYQRRFDQISMLLTPTHSEPATLSPSKWTPAEFVQPVETTAFPNPTPQYVLEPRPFSASETSAKGHRTTCEDLLCRIKDLQEKCSPSDGKISVAMKTNCQMCYPKANMELVNAHCRARWRREKKVFYALCISLIFVTIASSLAIYIHKRRRMTQKHSGASNQSLDGPGLPMASGRNRQRGPDKHGDQDQTMLGEDDYWDGVDVPVSSSTAQHKWEQVGLFPRAGRKRIQDLFNLEAMKSRRDLAHRKSQSSGKVPVMPWAPNATVRASNHPEIPMQSSQRRSRANAVISLPTSKSDVDGGRSVEMCARPKSDSIV
jgi:hypothetical protein